MEENKELCKKDSKRIAYALFLYNILAVFVVNIAGGILLYQGYDLNQECIVYILNGITTVISVSVIVYIFSRKLKTNLALQIQHVGFIKICKYTVIGMGLSIIMGIVVQIINEGLAVFGWNMSTPDFSLQTDYNYNLILLISTCIIAPIFEELLFRGLILQTLRRYGNVFAIIVTSLLFALMHGNIPQAVPVFFLSVVICFAVIKTGSLWTGIAIHFLNNALSVSISGFLNNQIVVLLYVAFEFFAMGYAIYFIWKHRNAIQNYILHNKSYPFTFFFRNWASMLYLILSLIPIITSFVRV